MSARLRTHIAAVTLTASVTVVAGGAVAQSRNDATQMPNAQPGSHSLWHDPSAGGQINQVTATTGNLLAVPLVNNLPGGVSAGPTIKNPMAGDPESPERGMKYFAKFNCAGCHAANGGGGMGIALSNSVFKYGSDPAKIFLVISHGAPLGMPAWGTVLPDNVIWDIVSYIQSISKSPTTWGTTVSIAQHEPAIEQVPAEFKKTSNPWAHVEPFSKGQKPTNHNPTEPLGQASSNNHNPH